MSNQDLINFIWQIADLPRGPYHYTPPQPLPSLAEERVIAAHIVEAVTGKLSLPA